jgi:hypothetical protein
MAPPIDKETDPLEATETTETTLTRDSRLSQPSRPSTPNEHDKRGRDDVTMMLSVKYDNRRKMAPLQQEGAPLHPWRQRMFGFASAHFVPVIGSGSGCLVILGPFPPPQRSTVQFLKQDATPCSSCFTYTTTTSLVLVFLFLLRFYLIVARGSARAKESRMAL